MIDRITMYWIAGISVSLLLIVFISVQVERANDRFNLENDCHKTGRTDTTYVPITTCSGGNPPICMTQMIPATKHELLCKRTGETVWQ